MMGEEIFDYSRAIDAPYWIQEIRSPKGKMIWYFSTPVQLSFFVVFFLVLIMMLAFFSPFLTWLSRITHTISLSLYGFLPYKIAKAYVETEPDGKKVHTYLWDYLKYSWDYAWDKRAVYQGERVELEKEFVFEKTNL